MGLATFTHTNVLAIETIVATLSMTSLWPYMSQGSLTALKIMLAVMFIHPEK